MKPGPPLISALVGVACVSVAAFCMVRFQERASNAFALRVKAVAHQWWWEFDYPSLGVKTADVLYLPSSRDVRLELSSGDVIHSFWIAGMKASVDIFPGKARLLDLVVKSPGKLYGNCDAGCGCGAVCMRFRVMVSSPVQFQRWAALARLHRSEFKAPQTAETPDCALLTDRDGHTASNYPVSPVSRLQELLDKGSTIDFH